MGTSTAHGEDATLDVVTLNAWGLPAPIAPARAHRMKAVARWLERVDPDVVGLQEVWSGAVPLLPIAVVRSAGDGDDGLAIRAKRRFTDVTRLRFDDARGFDKLKRKGALRARIELVDGSHLWFVVTHLQAGTGRQNAATRERQLDQILGWIAGLDGPVVLLGDLNMDDRYREDAIGLLRLTSAGFVDVAARAGVLDATYPGDGHRYDRIYVRGTCAMSISATSVEVVRYDDDPDTDAPERLSDHRPLRARLLLHRAPLVPRLPARAIAALVSDDADVAAVPVEPVPPAESDGTASTP